MQIRKFLKKFLFTALMASSSAALIADAAPIPAFSLLGTGPAEFKFVGMTAPSLDGGTGLFGSGVESTFGGGYLTSISEEGSPANILWSQASNNQTISYMLYGIADESAAPGGTNGNNLFNTGCTVGPNCDGKIHIDFYVDNLTSNGGTNPSLTGAGGVKASDRVGNTLAGLTDGNLLMRWVLVPGIVPGNATTTLFQNVTSLTLPATGDGSFLADCVSGPGCADFSTGTQLAGADFFGQFTLTTATGANGWFGHISDPVIGMAGTPLPEPTTLLLFAIGIIGFYLIRRKT